MTSFALKRVEEEKNLTTECDEETVFLNDKGIQQSSASMCKEEVLMLSNAGRSGSRCYSTIIL